jgi:transcriptional regulator with XRE-family HTH domain
MQEKRRPTETSLAESLRRNLRRVLSSSERSQADVARDAGLTPLTVSRIVGSREYNPTTDTIEAIARALSVPARYLIADEPPDAALGISSDPRLSRR